nr:reverse transcriptase domain-containing protein [Tanacetum cinerariifolium]
MDDWEVDRYGNANLGTDSVKVTRKSDKNGQREWKDEYEHFYLRYPPDVAELKDMVKALPLDKKSLNQSPAPVKAVEESFVTCGGAHSYRNIPAIDVNIYHDNIQEFVFQASVVNYNQGNTSYRPPMIASTSSSGTLPSNTIANPRSDLKAITTRSGVSYDGPKIPPPPFFLPKVVEDEPETTKDTVNPTNNGSTEDIQPYAPKPNPKTSIPYPSRRNDERNREKANNQIERFYQMFKDMIFKISFADALILMPKFASTLKALIGNKEKLRDPGKFLIPCDFPGMAECLALAALGASINLMPLSVWKQLSLPDLTPTCMTLELADHLISCPIGVEEDVYVKVGLFHFLANFVVVDFDVDPRVPLILGRSFLKTGRALIDVFEGELTLRVGKEAITLNLDQTLRYSANYSDMTAKRIDVIDMAYEDYSQEVLGFFDVIVSGNPTPFYDPIVSTTSSTLTPFGNNDFFLEEGDILLLEALLSDDPSLPFPNQGNYLPKVHKEPKIYEAKSYKSLIDEPPEVELKDLPPHLEYAFLEGDDKLPKLSDIKGIDPEFCTHKILMEEDFEPAVQHQRRVNPKIHDVFKQEVIKLLDAGLIYPISDSPWVSPVHCVPKKGGFTVVENKDSELILTRLVTGWCVCIEYRKLNEATRKDHFPLPFIDHMLDHCFTDGFSGYFQIPIDLKDQEKTTFTCPYETFAYRRMPFGLCNAPGTNSFQGCLSYLERMMKRCEDTNLCLNWENSHFMVKEGIVLGHKISKQGIEVDKAKVDVIIKLPHPTTVKAFQTLIRKLTEAPILIAPDWDMPFELMCDASDFNIGAVLGQRQDKHFRPIHYASKTMTKVESNYTTTEKEILAVVYAFEKFRSYLIVNKSIMYTDHSALKYLFAKKDSKARLLRWVLLLQEFTIKTAGDYKKVQINELHDQAYKNSLIYNEKTKRLHDSKIMDRISNIGDRVLLLNSRLKIFSGKLKSRWSGPFTISQVYPYGTVELSQPDRPNFKVNCHRLKHYFREDVPKLVVPDLQTFPRDH